MTDERTAEDVVSFLVGHHDGQTVREKHYGRELVKGAREAVDALPAVDWTPPKDAQVIDLSHIRARRTGRDRWSTAPPSRGVKVG